MKKLSFAAALGIGTMLATSALAANCVKADCNGYSATLPENCDEYIRCPFDTSQKACTHYKDDLLDSCPAGKTCVKKYKVIEQTGSCPAGKALYSTLAECERTKGFLGEETEEIGEPVVGYRRVRSLLMLTGNAKIQDEDKDKDEDVWVTPETPEMDAEIPYGYQCSGCTNSLGAMVYYQTGECKSGYVKASIQSGVTSVDGSGGCILAKCFVFPENHTSYCQTGALYSSEVGYGCTQCIENTYIHPSFFDENSECKAFLQECDYWTEL